MLETGRWASRVLLVTDGSSTVPVRLVRDGTPALAVGRGDGSIELRTLEVGQNPFRRGDLLVTSGVGGLYPPNIPVAVVTGHDGERAIGVGAEVFDHKVKKTQPGGLLRKKFALADRLVFSKIRERTGGL